MVDLIKNLLSQVTLMKGYNEESEKCITTDIVYIMSILENLGVKESVLASIKNVYFKMKN